MNKHITRFLALSTFSVAALAASVPNTFTAGTPAVASQVNANFTALVNAATALETKAAALETKVTALETKVAALESVNTALTAADVVGTYKLLSLESETGSNAGNHTITSASGSSNVSLTFTATSDTGGTFTYSAVNKSAGFRAQGPDCTNSGCTSTGYVSTNGTPDESDSGSGTWALGANNTVVVSPPGSSPVTVYFSKAGRVGFAVEVNTESDEVISSRRFSLDALIRIGNDS